MNNEENVNAAINLLDQILQKTNFEDVSAESTGFEALPDGYYLSQLEDTKLTTSKNSGQPMVSLTFKIVEDGHSVNNDNQFVTINGTKNRKIFKHYVMKDESSVKRFASDMLKFEDDNGPVLPKEAFTTSETILDSLDAITGMNIYIQSDTSEKDDGSKSTWYNLISWKRSKDLELPV